MPKIGDYRLGHRWNASLLPTITSLVIVGARVALNELAHDGDHCIPKSLGIGWEFVAVLILRRQIDIDAEIKQAKLDASHGLICRLR
jgi:hypothetical protein